MEAEEKQTPKIFTDVETEREIRKRGRWRRADGAKEEEKRGEKREQGGDGGREKGTRSNKGETAGESKERD